MADIASALRVGTMLDNKYRIENILGSGGFGITYGALNVTNNQRCAIKEFFPRQIAVRMSDGVSVGPVDQENYGTYEHGIERFLEEADALQTLHNVSRVVEVYDFFQQNGTCYFVMEYLDGMTLRKLAKVNGGTLSWENLRFLMEATGNALAEVHAKGIFHRDISPDNIFVTRNLDIKLIDFGNAKSLIRTNESGLSVFLKPGFAPLEQYSSKGVQGTWTDVYSLAASLYFLLVGEKVPDATARFTSGYTKLAEYGYSNQLSDGIDRALALNYKERTQTVEAFMRDIGLNVNVRDTSPRSQQQSVPSPVPQQQIPAPSPAPAPYYAAPAPVQNRQAVVEIHIGSFSDVYALPPNQSIIIGRSPQRANIVMDVEYISGAHVELFYESMSGDLYVVDHSRNGTFINDMYARVRRDQPIKIPFETILYLGTNACWIKVGFISGY